MVEMSCSAGGGQKGLVLQRDSPCASRWSQLIQLIAGGCRERGEVQRRWQRLDSRYASEGAQLKRHKFPARPPPAISLLLPARIPPDYLINNNPHFRFCSPA
jgi:hypothetical protein